MVRQVPNFLGCDKLQYFRKTKLVLIRTTRDGVELLNQWPVDEIAELDYYFHSPHPIGHILKSREGVILCDVDEEID